MKKRILALALCLVMAVSLLPVTAYGENPNFGVYITGSGFEMSDGSNYVLKDSQLKVYFHGYELDDSLISGTSQGLYQDSELTMPVTEDPAGGGTFYFKYQIQNGDPEALMELYNALNASSNCSLVIPGFTASFVGCRDLREETTGDTYMNIIFQVTKIHEHRWHYEKTADNSLTVICKNSGCPIGEVGVTIDAHSVTLPDSPFNAQLKLEGDAKEVFSYGDIEYKYEDPGTGWEEVDPDTFTPKAGRYQAGILIYGLPANGGVAARAVGNEDGFGQGEASVYLFVKYNAVDPAVTAQTGDNRPIELMMISAAVFSALAAAAFILDHKRRNASL